MANILIPEELNALIQQYLTDGVLTDKERQVILNEAEKMGLNREKIDLILDAEVQKIDQQTDAAARKQKGKQCPYCGGSIPLLTDKCPHCGENITAQASEELQEIFDNLEEALVDLKSGKDFARSKATVERYSRKAKMYYGSNPKIQKLLQEVENEMSEAEKRTMRNAKQQGFVSIITNKWVWTVVVAIIFGLLSFTEAQKRREANERYADLSAQEQYTADRAKAYAEMNSHMDFVYLLLGIGATCCLGSLAVKDSKNKK